MFLSAVLFVLFVAGCWLYCLADAVLTPAAEVPGPPKPVWITAIALTFILGAIAWVIARKWWRIQHRRLRPAARPGLTGYDVLNVPEDPDRPPSTDRLSVAEALARHPASQSRNMPGRAAPIGPDDDPEFLRMLDRLISGTSDSSELPRILAVFLRGADWQYATNQTGEGAYVGGTIRTGTIGAVVLAAALAGGGLTTVHLLGSGHDGAANPVASGTPTASGKASAESFGAALAGTPQVVAVPRVAVMPAHAARATGKPTPSGSHPGPSISSTVPVASHLATGQAPSQSSPPVPSGSAACAHPQYVTSDPSGMWNLAPYYLANDMWNVSGYNVSQTIYGCSYSDWYAVATMDNSKGDGAAKTYPNSHRDFATEPEISSFNSITSTFAETSPDTGIYEDTYDIWLNGVATSNSTEVMIWTDNHGQTPAGSVQGTVTVDGRSYTVWKTTGNYVAFVANTNFTSASMNLLAFFKWLMSKGWITDSATLGQVDYGAELVSTGGVPATFAFSNFSVSAS